MRRRFQRIARALYLPTLGCVAGLSDREVARLYTSMVAPTPALALATFRVWEGLPLDERDNATERMRFQVARMAPKGRKP